MIRAFKKRDVKEWCRIKEENLLAINSKHYPREIINYLVCTNTPEKVLENSKQRIMLVAEDGGRVVGTISLTGDGEINNLFVKPELHGTGIGKGLLKAIEEKAASKGLNKLFLYASTNAVDFYKKNGYEKEHEEVEEINNKEYKVVFMTKRITTSRLKNCSVG